MTEAVVHDLEAIDVQAERGKPGAGPRLQFHQSECERVHEGVAIQQSREWIALPRILDLLAHAGALGDVAERASEANHPAAVVTRPDGTAQHPTEPSVVVTDAVFVLDAITPAGGVNVDGLQRRRDVFGMDPCEPLSRDTCSVAVGSPTISRHRGETYIVCVRAFSSHRPSLEPLAISARRSVTTVGELSPTGTSFTSSHSSEVAGSGAAVIVRTRV